MFTKWSKPHPIRLKSDFFWNALNRHSRQRVVSAQYCLQLCPNTLYNEWANKSAVLDAELAWMCLVISALRWDAVMDVSRGKISSFPSSPSALTAVVWESLTASCWCLHHCCSNWGRCSRYLLTWPKRTDQISCLAKWKYGWSVLKFASEKQDLCAMWTKAAQRFYTLQKALNMIQIFQTDFQSCGEYENGRKRKLHYENHLLINTQSYWIQPSHNQRNNGPLANASELLYCGCAMWLSFHFLAQILRRLAGEQSQQAKLAGCLHHFIVCAPSKDLSRSPNTSQLMIKHQGQDNVSECRCWETLRLMKIFQGLCAPWPIADGFWKCHSPVAEIVHAGDTANTKVWIGCGMHNSQANKNFPWAICRLGDSWLDVMSGEMRMCLDVQYFHLYVKDGNMKFQSRGEKMDDTSTYRKRDCPDNTLWDVSS